MNDNTSRQQRMIERIQEDERLRGDLEGQAAKALVEWATERVRLATADSSRPDEAVEAEVQAIRSAARAAAHSGESEPQSVIAQAAAALAQHAAPAPPSATLTALPSESPPAPSAPAAGPTVAEPTQEASPAACPPDTVAATQLPPPAASPEHRAAPVGKEHAEPQARTASHRIFKRRRKRWSERLARWLASARKDRS